MTNIDFTYSPKKNDNYYGSDLNRFIDEQCSRKMICINVDCFLVKFTDDGNTIRFIESKHNLEGMKRGQEIALSLMTQLTHPNCSIEVFIVRGDYPYDTAVIEDLQSSKKYTVSKERLIAWLNFEEAME